MISDNVSALKESSQVTIAYRCVIQPSILFTNQTVDQFLYFKSKAWLVA